MTSPTRRQTSGALIAAALLAGCATTENPDPLQSMNRKVFAFNETVDEYVIKPPATVYRDVVPSVVRTGVDNFFGNLRDVYSAFNLMLQGRVGDGVGSLMRFSTNTVFGFGGLMDWATELRMERHNEDFGQTLGVWGFGPGAYIVWPILGPSSVRDSFGLPLEVAASPEQWAGSVAVRNSGMVLRVVNQRAKLLGATDLVDDVALDKYSFVRDAYLQRRRSLVYDGDPPDQDTERYDLPESTPAPAR